MVDFLFVIIELFYKQGRRQGRGNGVSEHPSAEV